MTVTMQSLRNRRGNTIITNKSLASMGYGLAGAIGSAFARPGSRVIHIEGDGGFAQNMQDLGTVMVNRLNVKTFIFVNGGYASIRMTQQNYFGDHYIGCDENTGLGLPNWSKLFKSFDIPAMYLPANDCRLKDMRNFIEMMAAPGPAGFLVSIHPEQTYFPKISSRVRENGGMISNPLHKMTPDLSKEIEEVVMPYIVR